MREHHVACRIEGDLSRARELVRLETECFYVEMLERVLVRDGWSREEQLELTDRVLEAIKAICREKE
ncbi:MAG: hypothetical protein HFI33_02805 [Lachnospiraceae bacterium]|nr:hypothetical protein [Lachnospiraceae bacterium]